MGILKRLFGIPDLQPEYVFNPVGIPLPGQAYHAPLVQFQSYPQNVVQGRGTAVMGGGFFKPFESQYDTVALNPVEGASIGTITGQLWHQPLTDASIGNVG